MSFYLQFDVVIVCVDNVKTRLFVNDSLIFVYRQILNQINKHKCPNFRKIMREKINFPLFCDVGSEEFRAHTRIMSIVLFL